MPEIVVMEKPDWVTYEDIHEVLYRAHESTRQQGFVVRTALMDGEALKRRIGSKGKCFVALDGDKVVGTVSYRIIERNFWCVKGPVVDRILGGVIPEYKGRHISTMLFDAVKAEAEKMGFQWIESDTQEQNMLLQKINVKDGYEYVSFGSVKPDHYTVVMIQWLGTCPYSKTLIRIMYNIKKALVKLRYKPGQVKRFGI